MTDGSDFNYERMMEDAMRGLVRDALRRAAATGLTGNHHFYISFRTGAPGVEMAPRLRAQYPEDITVVLQHQYWNLEVGDDAFSVELAFSGKRERLVVPYAALTGFADPSVQFGLKFGAEKAPAAAPDKPKGRAKPTAATGTGPVAVPTDAGAPPAEKVVSLDQFRKK